MENTRNLPLPEPLLQVDQIEVPASGTRRPLTLSLALRAGELHLVHSSDADLSTIIADLLLGLRSSARGSVRFDGARWDDMPEAEAFRLRGGIGRVLTRGNWITTWSVMDNVLLPARHHTVMPADQLRELACDMARQFGLPGLPVLLPGECATADLERAACVRAFLGRPRLVILEHPMDDGGSDLLPPLMSAVQRMRRRGGAVIWMTRDRSLLERRDIPADRRYRIVGGLLLDQEHGA